MIPRYDTDSESSRFGTEWTREQLQWKDTLHFSDPQKWTLTIGWSGYSQRILNPVHSLTKMGEDLLLLKIDIFYRKKGVHQVERWNQILNGCFSFVSQPIENSCFYASIKYMYSEHSHARIYIYCHPHTDCFVKSQPFSVARHVGRLKLGSKSTQLYVRLSITPLSQQTNHVSSGNYKALCSSFRLFTFLPNRIPECSISSKSMYIYICVCVCVCVLKVWFGLVWFYSISTIICYLMPNHFNTYILNIWFQNTFCR